MTHTNPPSIPPSPPRRRWSWFATVMSLIAAAGVLLVNWPGDYVTDIDYEVALESDPAFQTFDRIVHGWPLAYVRRPLMVPYVMTLLPVNPPPPATEPLLWVPWQELRVADCKFDVGALVVDLVVGVAIVVLTAVLAQWWRLRRAHVWQFSLRELLVLVSLVAAGSAWVSWELRKNSDTRAALAAVSPPLAFEETMVIVDRERNPDSFEIWNVPVYREQGPTWLRRWLGDEWFQPFDHLIGVDILGARLRELTAHFSHVRLLRVLSDVPADDLVCLAQLPCLEAIVLRRTDAADGAEGVVQADRVSTLRFPALPRLRGIWLESKLVNADGLASLLQSSRLEVLVINDTPLDDAAFACIGRMAALRDLQVGQSHVTDAGVAHLVQLPRLERLVLYGDGITDAGLAHVAQLRTLKQLEIHSAAITDAGLHHLHGLAALERLDLYTPQVTETGLAALRTALPACEIP